MPTLSYAIIYSYITGKVDYHEFLKEDNGLCDAGG